MAEEMDGRSESADWKNSKYTTSYSVITSLIFV